MPTEEPTLTAEEQLVLGEVRHQLDDQTITIEQIKTAHGALELDRIGVQASMPLPFMAISYLRGGQVHTDKIASLSSHIQETRKGVLDQINDAQKAL